MRPSELDSIAAVSTPPGKGGVALIRCSGSDAFSIVASCFRPKSGKSVAELPPRTAVYGDILYRGKAIDDGILTLFPAPHSYTGEDVAEICCHGGVLITKEVLSALLFGGARQAEAGEFTRRAFLNGRLSLTEAEGVGTLLEASTAAQMELASTASRKQLRTKIEELHAQVTELLAATYAVIDFPDEDLSELSHEEIENRLNDIISGLQRLEASYKTGRAISEGIPTVIVGRPNVGKSSLYNALSGEDLAIVTDVAGTTRDLLHTDVQAGRVTLALTDTAGLRENGDEIEKIGINRTKEQLEKAELVIAVFDATHFDSEDEALISLLKKSEKTVIAVENKCDLLLGEDEAKTTAPLTKLTKNRVRLSARSDDVSSLTAMIEALCTDTSFVTGADAILFDARQHAAVSRALDFVLASRTAFSEGLPTDVAFEDLELAVSALSELDGQGVTEEMVSHIFSRFCVGK